MASTMYVQHPLFFSHEQLGTFTGSISEESKHACTPNCICMYRYSTVVYGRG